MLVSEYSALIQCYLPVLLAWDTKRPQRSTWEARHFFLLVISATCWFYARMGPTFQWFLYDGDELKFLVDELGSDVETTGVWYGFRKVVV